MRMDTKWRHFLPLERLEDVVVVVQHEYRFESDVIVGFTFVVQV